MWYQNWVANFWTFYTPTNQGAKNFVKGSENYYGLRSVHSQYTTFNCSYFERNFKYQNFYVLLRRLRQTQLYSLRVFKKQHNEAVPIKQVFSFVSSSCLLSAFSTTTFLQFSSWFLLLPLYWWGSLIRDIQEWRLEVLVIWETIIASILLLLSSNAREISG